jgi:hypothetical protein
MRRKRFCCLGPVLRRRDVRLPGPVRPFAATSIAEWHARPGLRRQ